MHFSNICSLEAYSITTKIQSFAGFCTVCVVDFLGCVVFAPWVRHRTSRAHSDTLHAGGRLLHCKYSATVESFALLFRGSFTSRETVLLVLSVQCPLWRCLVLVDDH